MATRLPDNVTIKNPQLLYIGGAWVPAASNGRLELVSPHTEAVCAVVAQAGTEDVDAAVNAAREAFDQGPWPTMCVAQRAAALRRMTEHLRGRADELAAAFIAQVGALASFAPMAVGGGTETFSAYADIGENYAWEVSQPSTLPGHMAHIVREPVGVVAAIVPWNMPYAIMTQKVAAALISGCTVIMKPAPETPLEAYIIAEAAEAAGLPPGVLNLVPAEREAADALIRNPGVDKISFTGSTAAGRHIASVAAERMARVTLELGGKSPAIVLDDFPSEAAGTLLGRTITILTGQACAMLSRAIVPEKRYEAIADAIVKEMARVKLGSPLDPQTEMGPIAMKRQLERVEHYVETGTREGARLAYGGKRVPDLTGYYFQPTLFTHVDNAMTIAQEEIFGPVLTLIPARDLDHAVELANASEYGLNSSILTKDRDAAYAVARRLRTGNMGQNGLKADFSLPFGGFKMSGIGREGGIEGILPYVETKTILLETDQPDPS
jgi:acyl-CoA reductase-like NAD-dependent aldehyde dehydrogenase